MTFRLGGLGPQLLGLFVLPVTVVVLAVAILAVGIHRQAMRALVAERDERAAASAAAAIEEALRARESLIQVLASQASSPGSAAAVPRIEQVVEAAFPEGFATYNPSGALMAGEDLWARMEAGQGPIQFSESAQILTRHLGGESVVVFGIQDSGITYVGAILLSDLVRPAMRAQIGSAEGVSAYIVGERYTLHFSVGGPAPINLPDHAGVQAALRGERGSSFLPMADGEHVVAFAPIPSTGWALIVEEPWESVSSSLLDLSLLAPFSLLPILILALLGLWFGARRVIEPLRRLEKAASELPGSGSEAIETPTGGIAEIEELRGSLVRMSRRVREAQSALRAYIAVITNAQEEERRRVARELHDESIQHWIALDQHLQMAAGRLRRLDNPEADLLTELHQQVQTGIHELRRLSRGLRPIYLDDLGLVPAIDALVRDSEDALGIPVRLELQGSQRRLGAESELAVYRVVQESLANVARHANASSALVKVTFQRDRLDVLVKDTGRGFVPPEQLEELAAAGHYGLMGMRERADALGAVFHINSSPDSGSTIRLSIPLPPGPEAW